MKTKTNVSVIIALVAALGLLFSCGKKEQKTILVGHFASAENAPEEIYLTDDETQEEITITVTNGTFEQELTRDNTTILTAYFTDGVEGWAESFIPDCDTVRYEIDGSETLEEVIVPETSINYGMRDFVEFCNELYPRMQTDPAAYDEFLDYCMKMMEENPDNFLGFAGFVYASQGLEEPEWMALYEKLSPEIQAKQQLQQKKGEFATQRETGVGSMFKDFEAEQPDGTVKRLSDYVGKGKYVLVDFWASWCGPCIRETPYIRAAYDKYRGDRFDVLGVAVSDEPENTQQAISEHGIVWDVILNAQHQPGDLYGFSTIPTIFLFGPDGTLLVREGLRGDAIVDTLAHYLD